MGAVMQIPTGNPFRELWEAGYHRLVPVTPPDAPVTQAGAFARRIAAGEDPRGKAPGVRRHDGLWHGMNFVAMESREEDLDVWNAWGASAGIKTGEGLIAVDIDTSDQKAAIAIYELAAQYLGPAKVRFGNKPKHLLLYEAPKDLGYCWTSFSTDTEDKAKVEVLAEGRQFVAHGVHPKTLRPYVWKEGLPRRDTLTLVTAEQVRAFLDAVAATLPNAKTSTGEAAKQPPEQHLLKAPSWEALERAVEALPNTDDTFPSRDDYLRVAYAIKAAAPDGYELPARDLFLDWCDRWQTDRTDEHAENDPATAVSDWERAKPPYRIGYDFIVERAPALFFEQVEGEDLDMFTQNAQATAPKRKLEILLRTDIDNMRPQQYLIERHIPQGGLGFLYGAPGAGKSFLALDMALHLAYGREEWHGDKINRPAENRGWVIYLAREGSSGFRARIHAWEKNQILHDPDPEDCRFALIRETLNFMQAEDIRTLIEAVNDAGLTPIDLIIVDTVSRVIPGADENLQKDMTLFVQACEALQGRFGCAVMGVHHAGKSGAMRGSTVFTGAGDFIFTLAKDEKVLRDVRFTCAKQKDIDDGWTDTYALEGVEVGNGLSSLVPRRRTQEEIKQQVASLDEQERMLSAIQEAWDAGAPWTLAAQAKDRFAPRMMAVKFGIRADEAQAYLDLWQRDGRVEVAALPSNRRVRGLRCGQNVREAGEDEGIFD